MRSNAYWTKRHNLDVLEERGYTHIASIVKGVYNTKYYRLVAIEDIRKNGYTWPYRTRSACYYRGTREKDIDWSTTIRRTDLDK